MKLTLTSNNLISRYICIYAYEQIKNINDTKNNNNVNYLYDHTLPSWDYIPHNDRKKLKVMCLTIGNYEIPYKDTIIYLKIQYVKDRPLILDYDIVKEVILECSNADFLIEFVETAKKTTEDTLNREGRNLDSTIRKYIYDTTVSHPDWEIINICKKRFTETLFLPKDIRKNIFGFIDDFISEDTKNNIVIMVSHINVICCLVVCLDLEKRRPFIVLLLILIVILVSFHLHGRWMIYNLQRLLIP